MAIGVGGMGALSDELQALAAEGSVAGLAESGHTPKGAEAFTIATASAFRALGSQTALARTGLVIRPNLLVLVGG